MAAETQYHPVVSQPLPLSNKLNRFSLPVALLAMQDPSDGTLLGLHCFAIRASLRDARNALGRGPLPL
jgi:hypothetical protein